MFALGPRRWLPLLLLVGGLLAAAPPAQAQQKVQVTVLAILATDQNHDVDPKLTCVAREVRKIRPTLTGFRLDRTSRRSLEIGKEHKFPLADKQVVEVTIEQGADKNNRVSLSVKPPELCEICYTSCCGKYLPIVTHYKNSKNETLIVAIMVEPCRKK
jgi:hypothetical protein